MLSALANAATVTGLLVLLTACAGNSPGISNPSAGLSCVDDSPDCIGKRQRTLNYLLNAPDKAWISQSPSASAYASGVRLFALRRKKTELSCTELSRGMNEAANGPRILKSAPASELTPAQRSRGAMLSTEVARELKREHRRRCAKG